MTMRILAEDDNATGRCEVSNPVSGGRIRTATVA
jgi:hypothetical protein